MSSPDQIYDNDGTELSIPLRIDGPKRIDMHKQTEDLVAYEEGHADGYHAGTSLLIGALQDVKAFERYLSEEDRGPAHNHIHALAARATIIEYLKRVVDLGI